MTHLILWRDMEAANNLYTYAMTSVNMGDRAASTIAQTVLKITAADAEETYKTQARSFSQIVTWMS